MIILAIIGGLLLLVVVHDLTQSKHALLRNFPIIGHFRYWIEMIGPELRQYIVTDNDEERPFSRDQRRWIYSSSKKQNNYFGFGTDNDLEESPNYLIIKHAAFPKPDTLAGPDYAVPCAKIIGASRGRARAFRPQSIISISAMSFGSLSANAVEAIDRGCAIGGALHNTGEGGVARHHDHGAGLIWQLGTAYFGARDAEGKFSMAAVKKQVAKFNIKAIEIKLSQGAKPGRGGVLPGAKATKEIAEIRGIEEGKDCISPPGHSAFSDVDSLLDFVESIADETGLPVGIKSAVGQLDFWRDLADEMAKGERGVDYIQIDGGEGGTGAAPLAFSDHVSSPFRIAFARVYSIFAERGVHNSVVWIGSGRLGLPERALFAMGMGCDMVAVAREAMLSIGCIQAQKCHTGHCPTGVATQNKWLAHGLNPTNKGHRLANYLITFRKELMWLTHACGLDHPAEITLDHFDIVDECFSCDTARNRFHYAVDAGLPTPAQLSEARALMPPEK